MEDSLLISVVIPNYNRGNLLKETLDSLLCQTHSGWEAVVVDDGSTDNSDAVGKYFSELDSRISYIMRDRQPSGAPTCRNIGLQRSKGNYIIFLDSDDLLAPFCIEQRLQAIASFPEMDFIVFPMLMFSDDPAAADTYWNIETGEPDLLRFLALDAVWQTSGPVWKKSAVESIAGFTEGLACWQDVDFHLKALTSGLKHIKLWDAKPDIFYRTHKTGSISQNEISSPAKIKSRVKIFKNHSLTILNQKDNASHSKLKYLGRNVTFGAIKSINYKPAFQILSFGRKHGIFDSKFLFKSYFLLLLMVLRLYKLPAINTFIGKEMGKGKIESGIGKHKLIKN
jgi:glycosyltransferase involved in cell wall biosynthesis